MDEDTIYFYDKASERVREEDLYLNNFFVSPIVIDNKEYLTVEHYYQANKFSNPEIFERVRTAPNPDQAKILARENNLEIQNWRAVKENVMRTALKAKFNQHQELREKLISTGNKKLVEDSPRDSYWGGTLDGSLNRMGVMLMEIREELKRQ